MLKKIFTVLLAFLALIIISNRNAEVVQGEENIGTSAQTWRCLQASQVDGQSRRPPDPVDIALTGKGFPSLTPIYVVFCSPSSEDKKNPGTYNCTTGNPEFDVQLFGSDRTKSVKLRSMEVPVGSVPPQSLEAAGDTLSTTVRLHGAHGHLSYAFFGVNVSPPRVYPGQGNTLQYGTFEFQQDPKVGGCVSIRWDPYGRVFDSQSLEPITGATVTLLNESKQFVSQTGLTNPETTEADGVYNFFVNIEGSDPVTFYVNASKSLHTFAAEPNLHPNFEKAYYDIYKPDEPIHERAGFPEHRDIPLDPGTNPPFHSDPESMSAGAVRLGIYTRFEGTISHPLSTVTLVGKNSGTEVARTTADKEGFWTLFVPNDSIPQNEPLVMHIIKVDLTTLSKNPVSNLAGTIGESLAKLLGRIHSLLSGEVFAQPVTTEGTEFQPILTYVEGYAKDKNGDIIPNATVNVRLSMSDGLYFQTKADENGFFLLQPQDLPIFNYYLEFESPAGKAKTQFATADFAVANEEHLTTNDINLMAASKNGQSLLPTLPPEEEPQAEPNTPESNSLFAGNNANMILTVIALVALLVVAGGVLFYIKKKRADSNDLL